MSFQVSDFERQVIQRSHQVPVLVDFWAPWCGPCRSLGPRLERLAGQADGRWELAKINTEDHPELAGRYRITSIPAVKLFVNGEVADEFVGALPEPELRRFLDKALPSPSAGVLPEAQRLLAEGATAAAAERLEPLVKAEPGNLAARLALAQAVWFRQPDRVAELLEPVGPSSELADQADALRTLARLAMLPDHPDTLPPADVRERYLGGATALRSGDLAAALEAFIEVIGRDRDYDGGGAKAACRALFQILGVRHPLSDRFSRAFSSALHS